jgi:hypothetical protein
MELWVPWVKIAFIAITAFGSLWIFFRLKWTDGRDRPIPRVAAGTLSLLLLIFAVYLAFVQGGHRNSKLMGSPDGAHVARIMITSGSIVDSDLSSVIVRRSGSLTWTRAYSGFGYFQENGPAEPYVRWLDNSHLIIDYQQSANVSTSCMSKVEDIVIECRAHSW